MFKRKIRLSVRLDRGTISVTGCKRKGLVLPAVIAFALIFAIIGVVILTMAEHEAVLTKIELDKARAFYLAEAGLGKVQERLQTPITGELDEVLEESIEGGSYRVVINTAANPCYVVSTGRSGPVQKSVRVLATFLAPTFENAVFAMNISGSTWVFQLRGTGNPAPYGSGQRGGRDIINGNIFVDGDVALYEESSVNPAPAPNLWEINGDVGATGNVNVAGTAYVAGSIDQHADEPAPIDILAMDYANNNTHNVSEIFQDAGISSGYLPVGHELRDVFVKNPGDRSAECASTTGDDFFFEPSSGFIEGDQWTAQTPLHAGEDKVYYIDGDLWVHSRNDTFGFNMDGKATIVVTGDIHICDNLQYADTSSTLGLIALGKYDSWGNLVSGGNVYFGDPGFGTLYTFSAMMFAADDFLYNTDSTTGQPIEPETGFIFSGSFSAMDTVSINRDWYTKRVKQGFMWVDKPMPAKFDTATGQWVDLETGTALTSTEISSLRHYQMIVNYDDRVMSQNTQPPGLPRGGTKIFAGFANWEEL
jgi:hypothetical protein